VGKINSAKRSRPYWIEILEVKFLEKILILVNMEESEKRLFFFSLSAAVVAMTMIRRMRGEVPSEEIVGTCMATGKRRI